MSGYSTVCDAQEAGKLKGTARSGKSQAGAEKELFWSTDDFEFSDKSVAVNEDNWNTGVENGKLHYIGVLEEFDSNDAEATFYESTNGDYRAKTAEAKRIRQYRLIECSCTHAALLSFDGQNGRLFIRTSRGYLKARIEKDGKVRGFKTSQFDVGLLTASTNETPSFTPIDVTYATPIDDDKDVFEDKIDFEFSQIDQVENAKLVGSSASSDGSNFTFTITATKGCSSAVLTGAVRADFAFENVNGTVLATATVTETGTTGVYAVDITTDETTIVFSIDGTKKIASTNYVSEDESITAS